MTASILIVDDSLTVRMDLVDAFTEAGFQVRACASAAEARLELARQDQARLSIDMVILDVLLPDGDGIEFLQELRASSAGKSASVLMLSTEAEVKDRLRGLQTGADEYVGKPYELGYLIARAEELMRRRSALPQPDRTTILVIDDSTTFREGLCEALQASGYAVLTASSGEDGLRLAVNHRPSAILVDGILPGIDGATVIRRLRLDAVLGRIPCLLMTASEERGAELRALDAGADGFVRKDEQLDSIIARLGAMLRRSEAAPDTVTASQLGPKRVLAVDDSLTYLHELADGLRHEGYDVIMAHAGEEALDLLAVQQVDCILLDLVMPGIGGQETCRRIKSASIIRDIPLIMLTALDDRLAMIAGLGAGADDYISKASEFEVLKARVRAQLRRKQFEDENRSIRDELVRKVLETSEARAAKELAETRAVLVDELEQKNRELESFSYSVSHDLRAPLRSIDGFCQILVEDCVEKLDDRERDYLHRVRLAAQRMGELIDDLLALSLVSKDLLHRDQLDLAQLARTVVAELHSRSPERQVEIVIEDAIIVHADRRLITIVLENLIGNAWKFTGKCPHPRIEVAFARGGDEQTVKVGDNGAGFDMAFAEKLFRPFQRLHSAAEFPGTGIGLATVRRIIERHGGRLWVESAIGKGTTFFFTVSKSGGGRS